MFGEPSSTDLRSQAMSNDTLGQKLVDRKPQRRERVGQQRRLQ